MATAAAALSRSSPPGAAAAAAAAATGGAPTGAGELEGLIHGTVSFLGGLWSGGRQTQDGDEIIRESEGPAAFEDFDMLESGLAREYVLEEHLRPPPNPRKWTACNVVKESKTVFRMYLDDKQTCFMLSAKRVGDAFYISQYESFPETVEKDAPPDFHYVAVLRTCTSGHFKLFLNGCEACDRRCDKYTCGGAASASASDGRPSDRQLLAEVFHSVRRVNEANADMRCLAVKLPAVSEDGATREVWCPRTEQARARASPQSESVDKAPRLKMLNKMPEWNEDLQSLVLRFNKGRVLAPSAKNFLMCIQNGEAAWSKDGVFQFGKTRRKRYALDFRHPVSALQAFGICLSLFHWTA